MDEDGFVLDELPKTHSKTHSTIDLFKRNIESTRKWYLKTNKYLIWVLVYIVLEIIFSLIPSLILLTIDTFYFENVISFLFWGLLLLIFIIFIVLYVIIYCVLWYRIKYSKMPINLTILSSITIFLMVFLAVKSQMVYMIYTNLKTGTGCNQQIIEDIPCILKNSVINVNSVFWVMAHFISIIILILMLIVNSIGLISFSYMHFRSSNKLSVDGKGRMLEKTHHKETLFLIQSTLLKIDKGVEMAQNESKQTVKNKKLNEVKTLSERLLLHLSKEIYGSNEQKTPNNINNHEKIKLLPSKTNDDKKDELMILPAGELNTGNELNVAYNLDYLSKNTLTVPSHQQEINFNEKE